MSVMLALLVNTAVGESGLLLLVAVSLNRICFDLVNLAVRRPNDNVHISLQIGPAIVVFYAETVVGLQTEVTRGGADRYERRD